MIKKFNFLLINLFKIGQIKFAPGTAASLVTCILFIFLNYYFGFFVIFFLTILIFLYSIFAINSSYKNFDSNDPQEIVIDEFVGQMIPLLAIPIYETLFPISTFYYVLSSFITFRFFDILKPFPINYVDNNTDGAIGIMLDDVVAGLFSVIILIIFFFFIGG